MNQMTKDNQEWWEDESKEFLDEPEHLDSDYGTCHSKYFKCRKCKHQHYFLNEPKCKHAHIQGHCTCGAQEAYDDSVNLLKAFISKVAQKSREDALRWISYEEAPFPNHGREVLTKNMLQGGVMKLVRWDKIHKRFVSKGEHVYESQLGTHWMEIPELPPKQ